jgi:RNA polymerase sigma-70 factor (ECF subfamily)
MRLPRPPHIAPEQWERAHGYTGRLAAAYRRRAPWWMDPEDFVTEAWLALWRAGESYQAGGRRRFVTYAHQRVHGRLTDLLRSGGPVPRTRYRSGERPPPPPVPLETLWREPAPPGDEGAVSEELLGQLPALLARLPEPEREAVVRIDLEGQWVSAIARELGCDERILRGRRKRGLAELQRLAAEASG